MGDRIDIADRMLSDLNEEFRKSHAKVELLQLRGIGLPQTVESQIVGKIVARQAQTKARLERQVTLIQAQTEVIGAKAQGRITEILGQAKADAIVIAERSRANGTQLVVNIESESYVKLRTELGLTQQQLAQYLLYTRKYRLSRSTDSLLVGVDTSRLNIGAKSAQIK